MDMDEWNQRMSTMIELGTYKGLLDALLDEDCSYLSNIEYDANAILISDDIEMTKAWAGDILLLCKNMRNAKNSIILDMKSKLIGDKNAGK